MWEYFIFSFISKMYHSVHKCKLSLSQLQSQIVMHVYFLDDFHNDKKYIKIAQIAQIRPLWYLPFPKISVFRNYHYIYLFM